MNLKMVYLLIDAGANVNVQTTINATPLALACDHNNTLLAKALITAGANVHVNNKDGTTLLITAVKKRNVELVKALVNAKANVNVCDNDGESILTFAIKTNDVELVQLLIKNGFNQMDNGLLLAVVPYYRSNYGSFSNKENDNLEIVDLLINAGANVNIQNRTHVTPLILACDSNNTTVVKALIAAGANVNMYASDKYTPLILACNKDNTVIAQALIQAGADVNVIDIDGGTALSCAIKHENIEIIDALINAKADIPDTCRMKVLMLAIKSDYHDMPMQIINPTPKSFTRKKIETLLAIYNKGCSYWSELPQELLKIIITYAHPEYAMDRELLCCLHPTVLVDNVPLENLSMFIKDGTLNQNDILIAWQQKFACIIDSLKTKKKYVGHNAIQKFKTYALKNIEELLTIK